MFSTFALVEESSAISVAGPTSMLLLQQLTLYMMVWSVDNVAEFPTMTCDNPLSQSVASVTPFTRIKSDLFLKKITPVVEKTYHHIRLQVFPNLARPSGTFSMSPLGLSGSSLWPSA